MAGKQIEFKDEQTHDKGFERAVVMFSVACIVLVIVAVNVVGGGGV
ncbi:MAG: hypothetical protein P8L46_13870 [Acidimicrobiales bacterium]|nr:hypothetical protein [Acidimicrobiales bacterium]MDG2219123.1 hypothetical protein [Acidimicrobiales bacterium]